MKLILNIIFTLSFSAIYSQNIIIDTSDKLEKSIENPAFDIVILEPKIDTLDLVEKKTYTLSIGFNGTPNNIHILDYPIETYADINNLDQSFSNEQYLKLSSKEQEKYTVIVPKHKVLKNLELDNKWVLEIEIISERIKYTEVYLDDRLIKTIYYKIN